MAVPTASVLAIVRERLAVAVAALELRYGETLPAYDVRRALQRALAEVGREPASPPPKLASPS